MNLGEISTEMNTLKDWSLEASSISKSYILSNFKAAMEFINKVAEIADRLNHHPTIIVNFNNVKLISTTHSEKGLTPKDFELAREIDKLE